MRIVPALGILLLLSLPAYAAPLEPAHVPARAKTYAPERFFAGRTEGRGELTVLFSPARPIRVHGRGRLTRNGTLVLRQTVQTGDDAPSSREWRLRRSKDGRIDGSLSDASGPVTGEVTGDRLHLRYPMKGGLLVEQWLVLDPSGATMQNRLTVRLLGVPVARVRETIRKTK